MVFPLQFTSQLIFLLYLLFVPLNPFADLHDLAMVTTITWLCPSVEWHGLDILSSVSDNCQPLNLQITWITSDWLERRMPPDALGNNRCSCQGNIISDVTRREFIWKVHLMIPLQFGSFRVRYDPAFEIDVVLLLKFSNKKVKVWY